MNGIDRLLHDLGHPGMPYEIAALAACLVAAFGMCWLAGRGRAEESVWFGRAVVDGLLFPLLALVFV